MWRTQIGKVCLVVFSMMVGVADVSAQSRVQKQDWTVVCENGCVATQQLESETNQVRYTAVLSSPENTDQVMLRVIFPLGVYLPAGIAFKVGDYEQTHPMTVCLRTGCSVLVPVTDALATQMKANNTLLIRYFSTQDKANEIALSMKGITSTLDML
ncbi:invasion associated locus B family protein [Alteromonas sp. CYL-A6]|uniref:invasion associated locus B family protein n=1 Tax=Alteromonas nitratireducens TaxID=3390813 RepID=UPI0034AA6178